MPRRITRRRLGRWLRGETGLAGLFGLPRDDRDALAWQAHRLFASGRLAEAGRLFDLLGMFWPESAASARLGRGACRQLAGDLSGAERDYDEALRADPSDPHALANRAEVRLLTRRVAAALADLDAASARLRNDGGPSDLARRVEQLRDCAKYDPTS
jgi:Flp pilus assembly protein TadD